MQIVKLIDPTLPPLADECGGWRRVGSGLGGGSNGMVMGIGWTGWIEPKFACGSWGGEGEWVLWFAVR